MSPIDSIIAEIDMGDGIHCKTLLAFRYYCGEGKTGITIEVPAGFTYDKASVPSLARVVLWILVALRLFPPLGKFARPALLHDYLYRTQLVSRFLADAIMRDAARSIGIKLFPRWVYWFAVRVGGATAWNKHKEALNGSI